MARIVVSPRELKQFSLYLNQWLVELEKEEHQAQAKFEQLQTVWKDSQAKRFQQKFQEMATQLLSLKKTARSYQEYLLRKARAGEVFLGRRG